TATPIQTEKELPEPAQQWSIDLKDLLKQRYELKDLPNKRLAELRRCFEKHPEVKDIQHRASELEGWTKRELDWMRKRLGATLQEKLETALKALGKSRTDGNGNHHWRKIRRGAKSWPLAHGMLDLLEAWDFAQELDKSPNYYEPQEEEA
ncbi:MAG: hypothetical protein NZ701_18180, partial [Roseiflexus sp.]|nr:hypothetical protein [Roseiflexus sp.]